MSTQTPQMPTSPTAPATIAAANRLIELCRTGKNIDAINELYTDDAKHIEAMEMPGCERTTQGKANLLDKAAQFAKATQIHSASVGAPQFNGDQFCCSMSIDCTNTEGPMAGQRMNMTETCVYTVRNGKITEGKFFYALCPQ